MKSGVKLRVSNFSRFIDLVRDYDFVFFGSETCEDLVFYYRKYLKKLLFLNKPVTFCFPPLSQNSLEHVKKLLLDIRNEFDDYNISFSLNDFGTIMIVRKLFPKSEISIGRHLSKTFFSTSLDKIVVNSKSSVSLLKSKYRISVYEISVFKDDLFENIDLPFNIKFNFILHYPYVLLSTARNCIIGLNDFGPDFVLKKINCDKICLTKDFIVKIRNIDKELYLFENSVYLRLKDNINNDFNKLNNLNVISVVFDPS